MEKFIVKHYSSDETPIIKGFGFDGLHIGENREEAEEFISFVNNLIAAIDSIKDWDYHGNSIADVYNKVNGNGEWEKLLTR